MIDGVKLIDLKQNLDDRGELYEVLHDYDITKFGQTYIVKNWQVGTVRAFHRHQKLVDYFHVVNGTAKFVLLGTDYTKFDQSMIDLIWRGVPGGEHFWKQEFILSSCKPQTLVVPPGIFHGWQSLEEDTILLSTGSEVYDQDKPDEERIPYNVFKSYYGDLWRVQYK